jgi:hypothetical protein
LANVAGNGVETDEPLRHEVRDGRALPGQQGPNVDLRRRSGSDSMAIFACIKRRLSRLVATNDFIEFLLVELRWSRDC